MMMKKLCLILAVACLLAQCACAWAETGVNVEVITADGVSVVVLTPEETMTRAGSIVSNSADERRADLILPELLTLIEKGAFEGIAARRVEVSKNVVAIEARAFADCKFLREIHIPATVLKVDDLALEGCANVVVFGTTGTEAERFAKAAGFKFVDPGMGPEPPYSPFEPEKPPVKLPLVPRE